MAEEASKGPRRPRRAPVRFDEQHQAPTPSSSSRKTPTQKRKASKSVSEPSAASKRTAAKEQPPDSQQTQATLPLVGLPPRLPSNLPSMSFTKSSKENVVVVDSEEDEEDLPFEYNVHLQLFVPSNKANCEFSQHRRMMSDESEAAFLAIDAWSHYVLNTRAALEPKRLKAVVFYEGQPVARQWQVDLVGPVEYALAVDKVAEYRRAGRRVHVEVHVHAGNRTRRPTPPPSTPSSAAPAREPAATPVARRTTNSRQEEAAREASERNAQSGDLTHEIRGKWACSVESCWNHNAGGYCFYIGSNNTAEHHCPIDKEIAFAWSKGIREKRLTLEDPGTVVLNKMRDLKDRNRGRSYNRKKTEPATPIARGGVAPAQVYVHTHNYHSYGPLPDQTPLATRAPPSIEQCPPLSPLSSSQLQKEESPRKELAESFEWCKQWPAWKGYERDLDGMCDKLDKERYDLMAVDEMDASEWRSHQLPAGFFKKVKQYIKAYKARRGGASRVLA